MTSTRFLCARRLFIAVSVVAILFCGAPPPDASADLVLQNVDGWNISMPSWALPLTPGGAVVPESTTPTTLFISISKRFLGTPDAFGYLSAVGMTFTQVASNAATTIVIDYEDIYNGTTVPWSGFQWTLVRGGAATFDQSSPTGTFPSDGGGNPLWDFYIGPFTAHQWTQSVVPAAPQGWEKLTLSGGGNVPVGDDFNPGGRQGNLVINVTLPTSGNASFDLNETPIAGSIATPEPATMALLAIGGLGLAASARRRRRSA